MLDKQDVEVLRGVMREEIGNPVNLESLRVVIREEVCEAIDQIVTPQFESIDKRFESIDTRFDRVEDRLINIEVNMVTKDYLEDRLADFKADFKDTGKWVGRQMSRMTDIFYKNNLLTAEQVIQIRAE